MLRSGLVAAALALAPLATAQELVVFAASSLTDAFEEVAAAFEAEHPGARVLLAFDGSSTLALQILHGAPADVYASADPAQMRRVVDEGLAAGTPMAFAGNRLAILVPAGSSLRAPEDLAGAGIRLVLAAPEVPAGAYARVALARLEAAHGAGFAERVLANLVSEEPSVRRAAARVALGEVDAAIVYATDAAAAQGVDAIAIPDPFDVAATYPIVPLARSAHPALARAFVAFVLSDAGQAVLAAHGFRPAE